MNTTSDVIEQFLCGRDEMKYITNIECSYKDDTVKIIYNKDGKKLIKSDDFKPFVWAKYSVCIRMFDGNRNTLKQYMSKYNIGVKSLKFKKDDSDTAIDRLENGYRFMFYAKEKMSYSQFMEFFRYAKTPIYPSKNYQPTDAEKITDGKDFLAVSPVEQYMISSGKRLFKGYENYDDLKRLIFDLETQGLNPRRHAIDQIGIRTNKGFERVITVEGETDEERHLSEFNLIKTSLIIIRDEKPDVVIGYNSENFDWDFFIVRLEMLGFMTMEELSLDVGFRYPIYKKNKESVLKLGGEVEYFKPTIIWGISVIDGLHAVRRAQAIDSNMKSANLKYVTKYSSLNKKNRVYVPGDIITKTWNVRTNEYAFNDDNGSWYHIDENHPLKEGYVLTSGRYIVERYLLDDIWETDKVELRYNESNFLIAKLLPTTFQKASTMGTAGIWKLIMLAWSFENNLAIPAFTFSRKFTGGLSRLLCVGYVDKIVKLDYNSLYPSIILTWDIKTNLDITDAMVSLLGYVLSQREKYKGLKKKAGKEVERLKNILDNHQNENTNDIEQLKIEIQKAESEEKSNDKKQLPLKILGNSFFGSYGSDVFNWCDLICAEKTTCIGRQSLRLMISHFTKLGYKPIVGDSVTYDTPIIIKDKKTNKINILPICDIFDNSEQIEFDNKQYRDFAKKPYLVLTRDGFKDIDYVYKHKTNKSLHRIETKNGLIDVTEDHSLFNDLKNEVKPKNLKHGDKIEIYNGEILYDIDNSISLNKAWLFGFFMANGSSVYSKAKRGIWKLSNKKLELLERAKKILINDFNIKCNIKNHLVSTNVYNIVIENTYFAKYFIEEFYTSYKCKKVPESILNSSLKIKKAFIDGFCCGSNQGESLEECVELGLNSKVAMAGLYMILKELNINFSLHTNKDKTEFISFVFNKNREISLRENYLKKEENKVWNNNLITSKSEYVYDISANGTFVNALGLIMCHNTDGFNFQMPKTFRYTDEHPYIGKGLNRDVKEGVKYTGVDADIMEFDDLFMRKKMGLGLDEYANATINLSRKNYADYLADGETKKVGNTIKSKKMPGYIEKFLDKAIDMLLFGKGQEFLNYYYDYIEKIYNYQIPLRDIASKGKIKKTLKQYKDDCNAVTKAGTKKSRQVWYELLLKEENPYVEIGDTVYYINKGKKKGDADVKKTTKYFQYDENNVKKEITKELNKEYNKYKKTAKLILADIKNYKTEEIAKYLSYNDSKKEYLMKYPKLESFVEEKKEQSFIESDLCHELFGKNKIWSEDEILINCVKLDRNIIECEEDVMCNEEIEYNVAKYIEQFNNRLKPLLVCFSREIRDNILVKSPSERKYFTEEETILTNGEPIRPTDQDTYEALMTMDRREVDFWLSINEIPPFVKECGMDWENIKNNHMLLLKAEENIKFKELDKKYQDCLIHLTKDEIDNFIDEGVMPSSLQKIVFIKEDYNDLKFYFKDLPDMTPSSGGYIFDDISYNLLSKNTEEYDEILESTE